jgi:hypothetical protein
MEQKKPYVTPPGKGSLAPVKQKRSEKSPDFDGKLVLDRDYKAGETVRLAGWKKSFQWGDVVNLSINTYAARNTTQYPAPVERNDEDVPF